MRMKLAIKVLFFFPGTFLHELSHFILAVILGKAEGFSVIPKVEGDRLIFGQVKSRTKFRVLSSFIASAPLMWWGVLILIMFSLEILKLEGGAPKLDLALAAGKLRSLSRWDLVYLWLLVQLIWAGRLSGTDIKNFAKGFVSVSGFALLSAIFGLAYLLQRFT